MLEAAVARSNIEDDSRQQADRSGLLSRGLHFPKDPVSAAKKVTVVCYPLLLRLGQAKSTLPVARRWGQPPQACRLVRCHIVYYDISIAVLSKLRSDADIQSQLHTLQDRVSMALQ